MGDSAALSFAGTGIAAAEGIASYRNAKTNAELNNAVRAINNQQVYESMLSTYKSLEVQADQVDEAFIANSIDQQKAEARARGAAEAASGASGTGGTGLEMQIQEASVDGAMNTARMKMNRDRQVDALKSQGVDAVNVANQRIDRMPKQQSPSLLATGLDIGMSGFRNVISLNQFNDAWDSNFGSDNGTGFSVDSLVDSQPFDSGIRTA